MILTEQQRETAMTNTIPNDTRELEIGELDRVSGGFIKGALDGVCCKDEGTSQGGPGPGGQGGQNGPAQVFQQILQYVTQGQG
jgi:hypothetical protein